MTPDRWDRITELFEAALERSPEERAPFLGEACHGDAALCEEVTGLLAEHSQMGEFLERPAIAIAVAPPSELHTFAADEVISGRFRIVRFIGQGGMGEVYEAEDGELGGRVALKTIRPEIAADARIIARFKQEIKLSKEVTHLNVCRIFDIARHRKGTMGSEASAEEVTYVTMELLAGETLAERLRRTGRMTVAEAFPVVAQIADGLEAAHRAGIVHRDMKSSNVLLVPSDGGGVRAVVTDFGLALPNSAAEDPSGGASVGYTGTPAYMAPEQVRGGNITPATDIYSLGVVMYEMVTGALPFVGDTPTAAALKRLDQDAPSPQRIVPDLERAWETVILRCLDRNPLRRFGSALEVARALRPHAFLRAWRHRRGSVLGGVAAVFVLALSLFGYRAYVASRPERKSQLAHALLLEGLAYQESGKTKQAEAAFQKARELYAAAGNRAGVAEALTSTGELLRGRGDLVQAKGAYESALTISREIGAQKSVATLLKDIGNVLHSQGDIAGAQKSYESALALFRKIGDKSGVAVIFKDMGNIAPNREQAQRDYEQALAIFKEIGDQRAAASALDDIGSILDAEGYLAAARKAFEEELSIWRETAGQGDMGETEPSTSRIVRGQGYITFALGNLGDVLLEQGALSEAGKQFEEQLRIFRQVDRANLPWALHSLGELLLQEDQLSRARKAFEEALALEYELGSRGGVGETRLLLARLSLEENRPAEAEGQARQAEEQFRLVKDRDNGVRALVVFAQALVAQRKFREARKIVKGRVLQAMEDVPSYPYGDRLFVTIAAGRVLAAAGDDAAGSKYLESALADASRLGYLGYQLEARLGLGETRMRSGPARSELEAVRSEASAKGFKLIARKAAALLSYAQTDRPRRRP
jgi:tetratricopeptide (TPR) repeat protein